MNKLTSFLLGGTLSGALVLVCNAPPKPPTIEANLPHPTKQVIVKRKGNGNWRVECFAIHDDGTLELQDAKLLTSNDAAKYVSSVLD